MKIHMLVFSKSGNPGKDLQEYIDFMDASAKKLGHALEIIFSCDCQLKFDGKNKLLIKNKVPKDIKVLIAKANFRGIEPYKHTGLIKQFELVGIPVINNQLAVSKAKDKVRTLQILSEHKIPMPKTFLVRNAEYIDDVVKSIGKFPIILKAIQGSQGAGVSIVESKRALKSIIQMLIEDSESAPLVIQEYIEESSGKDIRIFIVGNKIVTAMERIATEHGEFRSNFKLGGSVHMVNLSKKEQKVALGATKACGLDIAGVDLLRTKSGPKVLEVNANPGLSGITSATGIDIAGEIIKYAVKKAKLKK